jgi:hypothetical protein
VEVASMGCDSISVYGDKLYWVTSWVLKERYNFAK